MDNYYEDLDSETLGKKEDFKNHGQKKGRGDQALGNESIADVFPPSQASGKDADSQNQKAAKGVPSRSPRKDGQGIN